jgi:2'-5' RNA ligase
MARLFVAVDLPEPLRVQVSGLCRGVAGARWSRPEQLHVTLRFLGFVPEESLEPVRERLAGVHRPPFALGLRGVGVFPPPGARKPARVLWVGLEPDEPLRSLKQAVDAALGPDPEAERRGFSPHLTLARLGHGSSRAKPAANQAHDRARWREELAGFLAANAGYAAGPWLVDELHLYRSILRREGALHEIVQTYRLG